MSCHGAGTIVILDDSQCTGCPGGSDWTDCINNTVASLGAGGTLQFKRGEVYNVSGPLVIDHEDVNWEATGSGARPIINFSVSPDIGGVGIRKAGATLLDLDIRGPHYNVGAWADFGRYGINASRHPGVPTSDGLYISGVSVNGFERHGLQINGENNGLTIVNSQFEYNGGSGLALFSDGESGNTGNAPFNVTIQDNVLSNNGENGMDSTASAMNVTGNQINGNGWANPVGGLLEGHGILLMASGPAVASVTLRGNSIGENARNGIFLDYRDPWTFDFIEISDNYLQYNGTEGAIGHQWGVLMDAPISNSSLDHNDAIDHVSGCYSVPSSGVTVGDNCCNGAGGPGPYGSPCRQ